MLDVVLKNGAFHTPDAVKQFQLEMGKMKAKQEILDASYAGVQLADVFVSNPDVQKVKIEFRPSHENDDNGGSYRSISIHCLACSDINGQEIDFDERLDQVLEDTREEIYDVLAGPYESHDLVIELDRSSIQTMIDSGEVSGLQAIKSLLENQEEFITLNFKTLEIETT
jgi:hypothetical protein